MKTILVVDKPKEIKKADISNHHLEGYNNLELHGIVSAIQSFSDVEVFTDLKTFTNEIKRFENCTVFPMFWGESSNVIKGHVPAICEANHIDYLGPDSYTCLLCNDKYISKKYIREFQLKTSRDILVFSNQKQESILENLSYLTFPVVVKPNFGGGSTGISNNNLVYNSTQALNIIKQLSINDYNPIIVEEYIEGYEVSLLLLGNENDIVLCNETQIVVKGQEYFTKSLWALEDKKVNFLETHYKKTNKISDEEKKKCVNLFKSFEKIEYMRIDGRVNDNGFFIIELTPDCYMGPNCDFSVSIENDGLTYENFMQMIFDNHFSSTSKGTPQ